MVHGISRAGDGLEGDSFCGASSFGRLTARSQGVGFNGRSAWRGGGRGLEKGSQSLNGRFPWEKQTLVFFYRPDLAC